MITAHKIALDPNPAQATYFAGACGTARFAYNWALAEWNRQYQAGERPCEAALRRKLNSIKDEDRPIDARPRSNLQGFMLGSLMSGATLCTS